MGERAVREWLDEEIERERRVAGEAEYQAQRDVDEAIQRRVRAGDRLSALINARWQFRKEFADAGR